MLDKVIVQKMEEYAHKFEVSPISDWEDEQERLDFVGRIYRNFNKDDIYQRIDMYEIVLGRAIDEPELIKLAETQFENYETCLNIINKYQFTEFLKKAKELIVKNSF